MRHPGLDNAVDGIESDEPTHLGILDRGRIGNSAGDASSIGPPTASASMTSPSEVGSSPIRDSISSAKPVGTVDSPVHRQ
jgi:hypothetical protein